MESVAEIHGQSHRGHIWSQRAVNQRQCQEAESRTIAGYESENMEAACPWTSVDVEDCQHRNMAVEH